MAANPEKSPPLMDVFGRVEAEHVLLQIVRFHIDTPPDALFRREGRYWLDLCVTPRPLKVRAGFPNHWGPHRYEPVGDLFLVPPRQNLRIKSSGKAEQMSIICEIDGEAVDSMLSEPVEWTGKRLETVLDMQCPAVRSSMARIAEEVNNPGIGSVKLVQNLFEQIIIDVARYCQSVADGPISGGLAAWRLRIIEERLKQMSAPPSLEELAALCAMSVRQLTRGFRSSRGVSIGDYLAQNRIENGKRLLSENMSIKEVAFAVGFSSPSAFSLSFRKATGQTPRQFRQRQLRQA